jgi:hypothetical protein
MAAAHVVDRTPPPRTAVLLGAGGAVPFVGLAVASWIANETIALIAIDWVVFYAAVILSFIGGAHWGFASVCMDIRSAAAPIRLLAFSVLPSLIGWAALLLPAPWSAGTLAAAFVAILPLDHWAQARSFAPGWWMRLRLPLSATVSTALAVTTAAIVLRFDP